jgi:hypothetical protein
MPVDQIGHDPGRLFPTFRWNPIVRQIRRPLLDRVATVTEGQARSSALSPMNLSPYSAKYSDEPVPYHPMNLSPITRRTCPPIRDTDVQRTRKHARTTFRGRILPRAGTNSELGSYGTIYIL